MLRTQAVGVESCRPRSGLLTWHPSASTADSLLLKMVLCSSCDGVPLKLKMKNGRASSLQGRII
jgi:hypothetical protein